MACTLQAPQVQYLLPHWCVHELVNNCKSLWDFHLLWRYGSGLMVDDTVYRVVTPSCWACCEHMALSCRPECANFHLEQSVESHRKLQAALSQDTSLAIWSQREDGVITVRLIRYDRGLSRRRRSTQTICVGSVWICRRRKRTYFLLSGWEQDWKRR